MQKKEEGDLGWGREKEKGKRKGKNTHFSCYCVMDGCFDLGDIGNFIIIFLFGGSEDDEIKKRFLIERV